MSSSGLIDAEKGGDSTFDQYTSQSSSLGDSAPTSKGQLGSASKSADTTDPAAEERGERTAANIRYGQGISEGGMGGTTTGNDGSAGTDSGYGRTERRDEDDSSVGREGQGYGGEEEMRSDVGA
ncbi:hypothetical protein ANO11243_026100 [Dothideomycetidae sp. 11243]|nr:hypothetical protein ANO11243_026100 [fungal sp. No.11243]